MTSPEVSIVLPTFNRLRYLQAAMASVFAQTFADWELVVADDGSDSETAAYLDALTAVPRVRVLHLPHSGNPASVRNAAVSKCRGEYLAFLDSDDVWLPDKLKSQIASLRAQPECGWSHTAFAVMDSAGELLSGASARSWPAAQGRILEPLIRMQVVIAIPTVVVRRGLFERLGGFDPALRMCEDYDLWLRLAATSEIVGVTDTLAHVRRHSEHYHDPAQVLEDRARALERLLAAGTETAALPVLRRERAKAAAQLARGQALRGARAASLRTLVRSSRYAWGYHEWWLQGAEAAVRVAAPPGVLRIARILAGRGRGGSGP
jgi:glycosyltransferase involved in cell wall biosynthesis